MRYELAYLEQLESESIHIMREVVAECQRPVMLYSIGKDSSVMLRLAQKAFHPAPIPFPLLHVDTGYKFPEMIDFRDRIARELGLELLVWRNEEAISQGMNPFDSGREACCGALKTKALLDALNHYGFDAAFGGARRDEEKSRAKERIFSFRDAQGQWDPKHQRPEIWNIYNARVRTSESTRIFPLSNWTERDIWTYILKENIPLVSLYYAAQRRVVAQAGQWFHADQFPFPKHLTEPPQPKSCRFRSLGCMPCTGAIESSANDLEAVVHEMASVHSSERSQRLIDQDTDDAMERKKREGYF